MFKVEAIRKQVLAHEMPLIEECNYPFFDDIIKVYSFLLIIFNEVCSFFLFIIIF